jgi:hypothetical protein
MNFLRRLSRRRNSSIPVIQRQVYLVMSGTQPLVFTSSTAPENIHDIYSMTYVHWKIDGQSYIYYASRFGYQWPPTMATAAHEERIHIIERNDYDNLRYDYDDITIDIVLFGDVYTISDKDLVEKLMGPYKDFYGYMEDSMELSRLLGWVFNDIKGVNVTQIKFMKDGEVRRTIVVEPLNYYESRSATPPRRH